MPDISMCASKTCPVAERCYRNAASGTKPEEFLQSYMWFELEGEACSGFWPISTGQYEHAIFKMDLGKGALLCNRCRKVIAEGNGPYKDRAHYCEMCRREMDGLRRQALDMLLDGRMADAAVSRDWKLLHEIARLAKEGPPAEAEPRLAAAWRAAIESYRARGWEHMTPERVREVAPPGAL